MKILHLEDNPRDAALARDMITAEWPDCFISVVVARNDFVSLLKLGGYDLILSDYQLPGFNGLEALQLAREFAPDIPFIFFSGTLGEERAIDAVRSGAADYVVKDRMQRLPVSVQRVLREAGELRDRRRVEQALAQEQYLLRLLMENLPAHVYFKDLHSAYLSVSRSKAHSHGLEPEQLKGKSDFEMFGHEHARRAFADEQRIISSGEAMIDVEEKIVWPDGKLSWMSATKLPLRDASGRIVGTFGISHDITARKVAEDRIREQAEIIDHAPVAIVITRLDNKVTYCNTSALALYGVTQQELLGHDHDDFLELETIDQLSAGRIAIQAGGQWTDVVTVITQAGRQFEGEFHMSAIKDAAGKVQACLYIAIDVTEKKKLEAQFLRAQRLESLGMLAAGIAHDLNNVLAPVLMGAPLLRSRNMPAADLQVLESIESSAGRGAALVRQILSFAHGAGGSKVLIQVKHLIRDVADLTKQTFPKNIRLDEQVPGNLWAVQGNPTQLHQVVLNLCVNARDAMPDGGVLKLHAENRRLTEAEAKAWPDGRPGTFVVIEVGDTGTGIPPEILTRIWEPFFTTKGEGKGTGLGLATVRGIAASHNGFVTLETAVGKGTTFCVFLPVVDQEVAPQPGKPGASGHPFFVRGRGELVLAVDDEQYIRDLIVTILSRFGYRVMAAANGQEAVALYTPRVGEVALVITDLGMPGIGGVKLAATLKRLNPEVRMLFISGGTLGAETPGRGEIVLPKPFTGEDLLGHVHRALAAPV